MPSRSKALLKVVAVGATISLVAAGCSSGSSSSPSSSSTPTDTNPRQLTVVEPDNGPQPVVDYINTAKETLDFALYEFDSAYAPIVDAVTAAKQRGVKVRIILSPTQNSPKNTPSPSTQNKQDVSKFNQLGFQAKLGSATDFAWFHQKTIIVDGAQPGGTALIMDFNLASDYMTEDVSSYDKNQAGTRGMAVLDTDPADVKNIQQTFDADFAEEPWAGSTRPELVWAPAGSAYSPPGNAITAVQKLINGATKTIDAYVQVFNYGTVSLTLPQLLAAAKRGVKIRMVTNSGGFVQNAAYNELVKAGAQIVMQPQSLNSSSTYLYIHSKTIVVDNGQPNQVAMVGSLNPFLDDSLNKERELSVLVNDAASVSKAYEVFDRDFGVSKPYSASSN